MRNLTDAAFAPASRASGVNAVSGRVVDDGDWVKTSVSLRRETRRRLKRHAMDHDRSMQEVVEAALAAYLD